MELEDESKAEINEKHSQHEILMTLLEQNRAQNIQAKAKTQPATNILVSEHFQAYKQLIIGFQQQGQSDKSLNPYNSQDQQLSENKFHKIWEKYKFTPQKYFQSLNYHYIKYEQYENQLFSNHLNVQYMSSNSVLMKISVSISNFVMKIHVFNTIFPWNDQFLQKWQSNNLTFINSGSFSSIFLYQPNHSQTYIVKKIKFSQPTACLSIQSAIYQYAFLKLASALNIGLRLKPIFGFDIICKKAQILFAMQLGKKSEQKVNLKLLRQNLLQSLILLHSLRISHNDIRPDNIQFSEELQKYVLIDFGLSQCHKAKVGEKTFVGTFKGTFNYCCLQMQNLFFNPDKFVDIYYNDVFCCIKSLQEIAYKLQKNQTEKAMNKKLTDSKYVYPLNNPLFNPQPIANFFDQQQSMDLNQELSITNILCLIYFIFTKKYSKIQQFVSYLNQIQLQFVKECFTELQVNSEYMEIYNQFFNNRQIQNEKHTFEKQKMDFYLSNQKKTIEDLSQRMRKAQKHNQAKKITQRYQTMNFEIQTKFQINKLKQTYQQQILQNFQCVKYQYSQKFINSLKRGINIFGLIRNFFMTANTMSKLENYDSKICPVIMINFFINLSSSICRVYESSQKYWNELQKYQQKFRLHSHPLTNSANRKSIINQYLNTNQSLSQKLHNISTQLKQHVFHHSSQQLNKKQQTISQQFNFPTKSQNHNNFQQIMQSLKGEIDYTDKQMLVIDDLVEHFYQGFALFVDVIDFQVREALVMIFLENENYGYVKQLQNNRIGFIYDAVFENLNTQNKVGDISDFKSQVTKVCLHVILSILTLIKIFKQDPLFSQQQKADLAMRVSFKRYDQNLLTFLKIHSQKVANLVLGRQHKISYSKMNSLMNQFGFQEETMLFCLDLLNENFSFTLDSLLGYGIADGDQQIKNVYNTSQSNNSKIQSFEYVRNCINFYQNLKRSIKFYDIAKNQKFDPEIRLSESDPFQEPQQQSFSNANDFLLQYFQRLSHNDDQENNDMKQRSFNQAIKHNQMQQIYLQEIYRSKVFNCISEIMIFIKILVLRLKTIEKFIQLGKQDFLLLQKEIEKSLNVQNKQNIKLTLVSAYCDLLIERKKQYQAIEILKFTDKCLSRNQTDRITLNIKNPKTNYLNHQIEKHDLRITVSYNHGLINRNLQLAYSLVDPSYSDRFKVNTVSSNKNFFERKNQKKTIEHQKSQEIQHKLSLSDARINLLRDQNQVYQQLQNLIKIEYVNYMRSKSQKSFIQIKQKLLAIPKVKIIEIQRKYFEKIMSNKRQCNFWAHSFLLESYSQFLSFIVDVFNFLFQFITEELWWVIANTKESEQSDKQKTTVYQERQTSCRILALLSAIYTDKHNIFLTQIEQLQCNNNLLPKQFQSSAMFKNKMDNLHRSVQISQIYRKAILKIKDFYSVKVFGQSINESNRVLQMEWISLQELQNSYPWNQNDIGVVRMHVDFIFMEQRIIKFFGIKGSYKIADLKSNQINKETTKIKQPKERPLKSPPLAKSLFQRSRLITLHLLQNYPHLLIDMTRQRLLLQTYMTQLFRSIYHCYHIQLQQKVYSIHQLFNHKRILGLFHHLTELLFKINQMLENIQLVWYFQKFAGTVCRLSWDQLGMFLYLLMVMGEIHGDVSQIGWLQGVEQSNMPFSTLHQSKSYLSSLKHSLQFHIFLLLCLSSNSSIFKFVKYALNVNQKKQKSPVAHWHCYHFLDLVCKNLRRISFLLTKKTNYYQRKSLNHVIQIYEGLLLLWLVKIVYRKKSKHPTKISQNYFQRDLNGQITRTTEQFNQLLKQLQQDEVFLKKRIPHLSILRKHAFRSQREVSFSSFCLSLINLGQHEVQTYVHLVSQTQSKIKDTDLVFACDQRKFKVQSLQKVLDLRIEKILKIRNRNKSSKDLQKNFESLTAHKKVYLKIIEKLKKVYLHKFHRVQK